MFYSRAPHLLLLLFFCSFASAQSYWKSQWISSQAYVKTLKIDEGRRWSVDIDLLKKAISHKEKTTVLLPHPNGELISFDLKEETVMAKSLLKNTLVLERSRDKHPQINSYPYVWN